VKRYFYFFLFALALFLLESAFQRVFSGSYFIPQLLILFITVFAISRDFRETIWMSFIAGFLGELYSGLYFGAFISQMLLACFLAYFLTRNVTSQDISISTALILVAALTVSLPLWAFIFNLLVSGLGLGNHPPFGEFYSWNLLWRGLVNLLFFFPINRLFKTFFNE